MPKNYYWILGVSADANHEEIKAAFRRRALELHPDRSGLESGPFQELQEAYRILGDPEARREYDLRVPPMVAREGWVGWAAEPGYRRQPRGEPFRDVESAGRIREMSVAESFETYQPSFEELFERFWGNFSSLDRPKGERLESLTIEVVVSPEEAWSGGGVRFWLPARAICPACRGRGGLGGYECWRCAGQGSLTTEYPVEVEYPSGVRDGDVLRVPLARFGIGNFYLTVLLRVSGFVSSVNAL